MNWFTNGAVRNISSARSLMNEGGGCEHVEADISKAEYWSAENDSWGREVQVYCAECWKAAQEEEDNQEECCCDCGKTVLHKDVILWKPYYFNPRDGSEPLVICNECAELPNHQQRIARDRADYEAECENEIDYDD